MTLDRRNVLSAGIAAGLAAGVATTGARSAEARTRSGARASLELVPGSALLVEKGSSRAIRAGADGLRYVSVHKRRRPLQLTGTPERR